MYGNFHKSRLPRLQPAFGKFNRTFFVDYSKGKLQNVCTLSFQTIIKYKTPLGMKLLKSKKLNA
jgi:hypothetical protein